MRFFLLSCVVAFALVTIGAAQAKVTDPRKCGRGTPDGPAHHAYWCAKWAAVDTVRAAMARRQHIDRWFPGVYCTEKGSLLNWSCVTILGGDQWKATLRWRALSSSWHVYTSIVAAP